MADPRRGYNAHLDRRMRALLPPCRASGTVIISNMGAANPRAAAARTRDLVRELGIAGLKIACVEGDDVAGLIADGHALMDEPGTLADVGLPMIGTNAYLAPTRSFRRWRRAPTWSSAAGSPIPRCILAPLMHRYGWKEATRPSSEPVRWSAI